MGRQARANRARLIRDAQLSRHMIRMAQARALARQIGYDGLLKRAWRRVCGWFRRAQRPAGAKLVRANALQRTHR